MRSFDDIFQIAADRKGGAKALESMIGSSHAKSAKELAAIPDDRWLAMMTKCIFQAGFNWQVVENKWPGFEDAFEGFDPARWAMAPDEDLDRLATDTRIIRNPQKIVTVRGNAIFLREIAAEHGSAGKFFAEWPATDQVGLLEVLKKRASRMGGNTAQYFLRFMGRDSFILSRDVTAALIREGVIDKPSSSKSAMRKIQDAFNTLSAESGRPMTEISRTLALSVGE